MYDGDLQFTVCSAQLNLGNTFPLNVLKMPITFRPHLAIEAVIDLAKIKIFGYLEGDKERNPAQ